ncbi:MAG: AAA family ATPase [Candidatus Woesearchaeota archaeon]
MKLISLKLENIRSYVNELIEFPEGNTLIKGDIGSGKSTILYAIEFALFGKINDIDYEKLLRVGTNEGTITLTFEHNNHRITIERTITKKKDKYDQKNVRIVVDDGEIILSPSEAKHFIFKQFNYPLDLIKKEDFMIYRYTIYTPQEAMKEILRSKSEERLTVIRKIFNIDKYETIRENLKKIILPNVRMKIRNIEEIIKKIPELKDKIKENSNKIIENKEILKSLIFEERKLKNNYEQLNQDLEKLLKNKEELLQLKINLEKEIELNKRLESKKIEIQNKIINFEKKISENKNNLTQIINRINEIVVEKSKDEVKKEIQLHESFIEEKRNLLFELEKKNKELETKKENLIKRKNELEELKKRNQDLIVEKSIEELEKEKENKENEISFLENKINTLNETYFKAKNIIDEKKSILKNISNLKTCPTCLQEVTDLHKKKIELEFNDKIKENEEILIDIEQEKNKITLEIKSKKEEVKSILNKIKEFSIILNQKEEIQKRIYIIEKELIVLPELEEEIIRNEKLISGLRKINFDEIKKEIELLRKELEKIEEKERMLITKQEIEKNIKNLAEEKNNLEEEQKSLTQELLNSSEKINILKSKYDENLYLSIEKQIQQLKNEKNQLDQQLLTISSKIGSINATIKNLENNNIEILNELNKLENEKNKSELFKKLLTFLEDYFIPLTENIESYLRLHILKEFDEYFRLWFDKLIDNELMTARINDDFSIIIEQNGYEIDFENLSGGEKTACSLAYRLALNETILNYFGLKESLIILDEPTDGFSKEQLEKVREILKELKFSQILIVSHEQDIESFVEHIIKVEKSNGISNAKIIM